MRASVLASGLDVGLGQTNGQFGGFCFHGESTYGWFLQIIRQLEMSARDLPRPIYRSPNVFVQNAGHERLVGDALAQGAGVQ